MGTRRLTITVEKERIVEIIATGRAETECQHCGADGRMLTPEAAAAASAFSSREVYRRVEEGSVHFRETPSGLLLVCIASLQVNR
jgi:hypothetical protein